MIYILCYNKILQHPFYIGRCFCLFGVNEFHVFHVRAILDAIYLLQTSRRQALYFYHDKAPGINFFPFTYSCMLCVAGVTCMKVTFVSPE
jgi:hypothetical protein